MAYMQDGQAGQYMIGQGGQMQPGGDPGMPHMVGGMGAEGQGLAMKNMGGAGAQGYDG